MIIQNKYMDYYNMQFVIAFALELSGMWRIMSQKVDDQHRRCWCWRWHPQMLWMSIVI